MKILEANWTNHPILGNFRIKFRKDDGTPYKTIVIAGENGIGKTAILESLFKICDLDPTSTVDNIVLFNDDTSAEVTVSHHFSTPKDGSPKMKLGYDLKSNLTGDFKAEYHRGYNQHLVGANPIDPRKDGAAYSSAQAVYEVKEVKTISAKEIDSINFKVRSNANSPQELKQLLVDIKQQDDNEYSRLGKVNPGQANAFDAFEPSSRMYRFKKAFNDFFDHQLKLDDIEVKNGEHNVIFKKGTAEIPIDKLSTGESQIVFRGGMLLKDIKKINKGIGFVDEPEISMHPRWQNKILKYYKDIFSDAAGNQTGQLIVATHSEAVVAEAMKDTTDTLVLVLRKDPAGNVVEAKSIKPSVLLSPTSGETNYLAFDIPTTDYHIALYAHIQELARVADGLNQPTINSTDNWIATRTLYDSTQHGKVYDHTFTDNRGRIQNLHFITLPTYIRNRIDHPDNVHSFTQDELKKSIDFMRAIIQNPA